MLNITQAQLKLLENAQEYCDKEDKSTGFMIQYMQDMSGLECDEVTDYLQGLYTVEGGREFKDLPLEFIEELRVAKEKFEDEVQNQSELVSKMVDECQTDEETVTNFLMNDY